MSRTIAIAISLSLSLPPGGAASQPSTAVVGEVLPAWTAGSLDIHQIATGRGNAALMMLPDGTTLLLDAGDSVNVPGLTARPDASRSAGQWIARYVRQMLRGRDARLDYALFTHYHPDHVAAFGAVAGDIPIDTVIDRGSRYLPPAANDGVFATYRSVLTTHAPRMQRLVAEAGSPRQLVLRHGSAPAPFEARIVSVNDRVWTGKGDVSKVRFPALAAIPVAEDRPTENMCSVTLRIKYGAFDFFTGGDQPGYPNPGAAAWHDVETDVAKAIGPTDVHVVNHHGSIEVANPFWLKTLSSHVMILPAWSTTHPSPDVLKRLLATRVYPGERDIFVTSLRPETKATIGPRAGQVASDEGHVVVRVEPGGSRYWVIVLDDSAETYRVRSVHGPYTAR